MKGPCWIKQWIADLAMLNEQFRNEDGTVDFAALGREEYLFRTALITGNFSKSSRAKDVYDIAKKAYDSLSEKGKKGGRPRKDDKGAVAAVTPEVVDGRNTHSAAAASLAYSGEFGNVRLTQDQYNDLLQLVGNMNECNRLIDDFSANLADGTTTSANHIATLKKWFKARKRFVEKNENAEPKNTMSFQEIEGQRQVAQLRKYGLIK